MRSAGIGGCLVALLLTSGLGAARAEEPAATVRNQPADDGRFELDALFGAHFFSTDLELGVLDQSMAAPSPAASPESFALAGVRAGVHFTRWLGLESEFVFIPTRDSFSGETVRVMGLRAHALLSLPSGSVRPFLAGGIGALTVTGDGDRVETIDDDTDFAYHWGAGIRFRLGRNVSLRLDGRHILAPSRKGDALAHDFEAMAALALTVGGATKIVTIERTHEIVRRPSDMDRDGIADDFDKCPAEPEDFDGDNDGDGCPEFDSDGDGIRDEADLCPKDAETKNGIDDADGCPEIDADGDGILGSLDKCSDAAEDRDGYQDDDGCPDPDNDGDGVVDAQDRCPTELETRNGFKDDDGCPDEVPKQLKRFTGVIPGITFEVNSDKIKKASFGVLDRAVAVLREYEDTRIEISGHTSDEGDHDYNVDLSHRRAEAVKAYLVSKGIAADRITTVGYGPDRPIADNKTKKGRERNRRIEFRLIAE